MMARSRRVVIRALGRFGPMAAPVLLAGFCIASTVSAADDLLPARSPVPELGNEPWPGFRVDPWRESGAFPLDGLADERRWARWDRSSRVSSGVRRVPAPPAPKRVSARESASFLRLWEQALQRAEAGDALGCRERLAAAAPRTLEGTTAVRRLALAAAVAAEDREAADSLFYRLAVRDAGRTGERLAIWRALDDRDPEAVLRLTDTNPEAVGVRAARAWAGWYARTAPGEARAEGAWSKGPAAWLLRMDAARAALAIGDREKGLRVLEAGTHPPEIWRSTVEALKRALLSPAGVAGGPDAEAFDRAAEAYRAGDDATALPALTRWIGHWPESPYRARAYLLRAHLLLTRGSVDGAEEDLRAAERLADDPVAPRAALLRAFVTADRGEPARAVRDLGRLLDGPFGAQAEAELLFDQLRLQRLVGDERAILATLQLLEEGFPESPWTARAKADTDPRDWRNPFRVVPPPPRARPTAVPAPEDGPWAAVLWGEDHLARTATRLREERRIESAPPVLAETAVPATPVESPREPSSGMAGMAALAVGARSTGMGEAGLAGTVAGLHLRLRAAGVRTQEPGRLPLSRRGTLELGLAGGGAAWRWSAVGEGFGRREGDTGPVIGSGVVGPVAADWRGGRIDVHRDAFGARLTRIQAAAVAGAVDVEGRGRWSNRQQWLRLEGRRAAVRGTWEAQVDIAHVVLEQPGERFRFLYPNVRLIRHVPEGFYLGARAAYERGRGLLLPVAGVERGLGGRFRVWIASEPNLGLTPFRETFISGGDWNVPDFSLPAERRDLDLRGGLRWSSGGVARASARLEWFHAGSFRTWRPEDGLWREIAVGDVRGTRLHVKGTFGDGQGFRLAVDGQRRWIRAGGNQVPYVPTHLAKARLGFAHKRWFLEASVLGVRGWRDNDEQPFGEFLRWDLEGTYRARGRIEYSVRIENLGNAPDRRWPGFPGYGRGVFGGLRYSLGS